MMYIPIKYWYLTTFFPAKTNYKYLFGYKNDDYKIKLLYIILPQMSGPTKGFDKADTSLLS